MSNDLLHPGPPPLTERAAQCAIDVIDFMAAVVRGVDLIDVTPEVRQRWRAHVVAHYAMLSPMDRQFLSAGEAMLQTLQANWPQLPSQQRELYRQMWAQTLPGALQFVQPVLDASAAQAGIGMPQNTYATPPTMGGVPGAYAGPGVGGSPDPNWGGAPSGYMAEIIAQQQAREQAASRMGRPDLAQQIAKENEALNIQTLSNLSQISYQSSMAVAKNMKY